jgi:hypothetical protein
MSDEGRGAPITGLDFGMAGMGGLSSLESAIDAVIRKAQAHVANGGDLAELAAALELPSSARGDGSALNVARAPASIPDSRDPQFLVGFLADRYAIVILRGPRSPLTGLPPMWLFSIGAR